jgi:hypothetical protein
MAYQAGFRYQFADDPAVEDDGLAGNPPGAGFFEP